MPVKKEGPAEEWFAVQRWGAGERWGTAMDDGPDESSGDGGVVWIAHPEEKMQRASTALTVDGDVWVIDPVDTPDLDELLDTLGEVRGVVLLLDRHWRDADEIADRHDVPVYVPDWFRGTPDGKRDAQIRRFGSRLPDTDYRARRVVDNRFWQEAALFDGETLIVPEALGTVDYYAPGEDGLGVHPVLRLTPPRSSLGGLGPERLVVGHGEGVTDGATVALERALSDARRGAPRAIVGMLTEFVRS